jgi:hypothetical protein
MQSKNYLNNKSRIKLSVKTTNENNVYILSFVSLWRVTIYQNSSHLCQVISGHLWGFALSQRDQQD